MMNNNYNFFVAAATSPLEFEILSTRYPSQDLAVTFVVRGWDPDIPPDPVPDSTDYALFVLNGTSCPSAAALQAADESSR